MWLEGQSKDEKSKNLRIKPRKPLNLVFFESETPNSLYVGVKL